MSRSAAAVGILVLALACGVPDTLVIHGFDGSAEGWLIAGDTGVVEPIVEADGGDPGGYIAGEDEAIGETWYFRAPDDVLSQLATAEYGTLSYSLKQSSSEAPFPDDDVVIVGPAGRLSYRFDNTPGTAWTRFSVPLSADAGWRWNWNAPATQDQMRSVLADPTRLEIRGEYVTGHDVGGLDRFTLTAGNGPP